MSQSFFADVRLRSDAGPWLARAGFRLVLVGWLIVLVTSLSAVTGPFSPLKNWPAILLLATSVATMVNAGRNLPAQNVIALALIIGGIGSAAHALSAKTGIPFGPCVYSQDTGRLVFGLLPWSTPFVWICFVVTSRGAARLVLRPWRTHRSYGFTLLGLAVVLAVLLELGLEPFAVSSGYWEWKPTKLPVTWYSAPIVNFFSWGITVLIALAFATPFFINKSPRPATRPDAVPLLLWLGTVVLLGASALKNGAAAAAAVEFGAAAVVTVLGIYAAAQKDTK